MCRERYVDAVDDGDAMHMTVEHRLENLEEGVVRNPVGERRLVRIELVYPSCPSEVATSVFLDCVV